MSLRLSAISQSKKQIFSPLHFDMLDSRRSEQFRMKMRQSQDQMPTNDQVLDSVQEKSFGELYHYNNKSPEFMKACVFQNTKNIFTTKNKQDDQRYQTDYQVSSEESVASFKNLGLNLGNQSDSEEEVVHQYIAEESLKQEQVQQKAQDVSQSFEINKSQQERMRQTNIILERSISQISQQQSIRFLDPSEYEKLIIGINVYKYGRQDKFRPSMRIFQISPDFKLIILRNTNNKITKLFNLQKVIKIEKGAVTMNFRRFNIPIKDHSQCLSICVSERTIDIKCDNQMNAEMIIDVVQSFVIY
ncbi:hypothetical protein pb186bvf_007835 [Paramecium bursaria]